MINIVPCVAWRTRACLGMKEWEQECALLFYSCSGWYMQILSFWMKVLSWKPSVVVCPLQFSCQETEAGELPIVGGHLGSMVNIRLSLTATVTIMWDSALQNTEGEVKGGRRENVKTERNAAWVCSCLQGCSPGQEAAPAPECSSSKTWVSGQLRPLYGETLSGEVRKDEKDQQFFTLRRKKKKLNISYRKINHKHNEKPVFNHRTGHVTGVEIKTRRWVISPSTLFLKTPRRGRVEKNKNKIKIF